MGRKGIMQAGRLSAFRLFFFVAALLLFTMVPGKEVQAASDPEIQAPKASDNIFAGDTVTIEAMPHVAAMFADYYIYFRITKEGGTSELYPAKKLSYGLLITTKETFVPETEGKYLIEICVVKNNAELTSEEFKADDSVTITVKKDISKEGAANISGLVDKVYSGEEIIQNPTVQTSDRTLDYDTDYDIEYENNVDVGTATVKITGKGFYTGSISSTFAITPKDLSKASVSGIVDQRFTFWDITQTPLVTLDGKTLEETKDYEVAYENNFNVGTATVKVNGTGNYTGTATKAFKITQISIAEASVNGIKSVAYTGNPITQDPVVSYNSKQLMLNTDYTLSYKDNTELGTATIIITGKGNFKGSISRTFSIAEEIPGPGLTVVIRQPEDGASYQVGSQITVKAEAGIFESRVSWTGPYMETDYNFLYFKVTRNGEKIAYERVPYYKSSDYVGTITFTASTAGDYVIEVRRQGVIASSDGKIQYLEYEDFTPQDRCTIHITNSTPTTNVDLSSASITGIVDKEYTGSSITQTPVVKVGGTTLKKNTDYYILYGNNLNVGNAQIGIFGKGNYKGQVVKTFQITPKQLTASMVSLSPSEFEYTGDLQKPTVTVTNGDIQLVKGKDYTLTNNGGTEPGKYSVTVSKGSNGNYTGSVTKDYYIGRLSLSKAVLEITPASYVYDGSTKEPEVTVKLGETVVPPESYTVTYNGNINAGKGSLTVTAKADDALYKDSVSGTFSITPYSLNEADVTVDQIADLVYDRSAQTPKPVVKAGERTLTENTDYTLTYKANTNVGTATVKIIGKGNYKGTLTKFFKISKKDIGDASIIIDPIPSQKYEEGSPAVPTVTAKDGKDILSAEEIEAEYKDNDKVGTARVILKGKGNYGGQREVTFDILEGTDYATYALTEAINDVENSDTGEYLAADKQALQEAIDKAKELLADENATVEQLEQALQDVLQAKADAEINLANDKAAKEAAAKEAARREQEAKEAAAREAAAKEAAAKEAVRKEALSMPSAASVEKKILAQKTDTDPAGSAYLPLQLKSRKQTRTANVLSWKKIPGVSRYIVYGNKCGKTSKIKKLATVKRTSYKHKKLKKGTYYKYVVIAVKKTAYGDRTAAISRMIHVCTKGGKVTNHKSLKVKVRIGKKIKAASKVNIKKGKKVKLIIKALPASKKLKVKAHVDLRFESGNNKIASISRKGVITGKAKGTCNVYVYAQNGAVKKVKVTVR